MIEAEALKRALLSNTSLTSLVLRQTDLDRWVGVERRAELVERSR